MPSVNFPNDFENNIVNILKIVSSPNVEDVDGCSSANWTYFDNSKFMFRSSK